MRVARVLMAFALLAAGTGCSKGATPIPSARDTQEISGAWYLVEGTFSGESIEPDPLRRVTLVTDPQNAGKAHDVAGFSGCNWYCVGLDYLGTLEAGTPTSTAMGCWGPSRQVESLFHAALGDVDHVAQTSDSLVLTGSQSSLRFAPIPPIDLDGVVGRRWILKSMVEGDVTSPEASTSPARGDKAWLVLSDNGTAAGATGCGRFEVDWTVFLGEVRLLGGPMTGMDTCSPSLYEQHDGVLGVLFAFTPTLAEDRLLLQGQSGSGLIYDLSASQ